MEDTVKPQTLAPEVLEELRRAVAVADTAEPIVITDDAGKDVEHLHVKLSVEETIRVMGLPKAERRRMAETILRERRIAQLGREIGRRAEADRKRKRKSQRNRVNVSRRKNR